MSLLFVVLLASPNADVVLDRALGGNLALVIGPVLPFLVLGSLISPIVARLLCLLMVLLLTAAGVGLWRGERWALRLELVLLGGGAACLFGSAVIALVFRPAISVLYLALAAGPCGDRLAHRARRYEPPALRHCHDRRHGRSSLAHRGGHRVCGESAL
jgi:hypothetical protein